MMELERALAASLLSELAIKSAELARMKNHEANRVT